MAKKANRKNQQERLMQTWWIRVLAGLVFLGIAYGFASLAIDSGNLLEYVITIVFIWWAVQHFTRAARLAFKHG
jgi:hypothetical protein